MEWVWRNIRHAPQVLHKDLGHFFCRFCILDPDTNAYVRLLRAIAERSGAAVMLATLNYEVVLEEVASIAGLTWNYGDVLAPGRRSLVVKPHGSCNFISEGIQGHNQLGHVLFDTGIEIDGRVRVLSRVDALSYCADQRMALGPAIVAFMAGKPAQICPSALADMQAAFRTAVMAAQKLAVVGVNPHVVDGHVWNCLAQTQAELVLCGDGSAFHKWVTKYRAGRPSRYVGSRFADCADQISASLV